MRLCEIVMRRCGWGGLTCWMVSLALTLLAAVSPAAEPTEVPKTEPVTADGTEVDVGPVVSARSLLGMTINDPTGQALGEIADVSLNVSQGSVAALFVTRELPSGEKTELRSLRIADLRWNEGKEIELVPEGQAEPEAQPEDQRDDADTHDHLLLLSNVKDIPVHNGRGKHLGTIKDFGIAPDKGLIAYAAFAPNDRKSRKSLYPIPLGAFVVPEDHERWLLELPEDVLAGTLSFEEDAWPDSVPRGWTEYVHVRYGRSPFGGVQAETHAEKNAAE